MVIQKIRQPRMQSTASRFTSRSAVLSFDSSALDEEFTRTFGSADTVVARGIDELLERREREEFDLGLPDVH
jgi:hypothetical protein